MDLTAKQIADSMGEDVLEVARIMRRRGQNLECAQKINVLLRPQDLHGATEISIDVLLKGKAIASGIVSLSRVLLAEVGIPYSEVINPVPADEAATAAGQSVDLDVEFSLWAVVEQDREKAV